MGFRVWGQNSIKNHSDIIPGLNRFSHISPPQQVCLVVQSHAIVLVYVFVGVGQRLEYVQVLRLLDSKWGPVCSAVVF